MSDLKNFNSTIFSKGGSTSKDPEYFLKRKLLTQVVLAKLTQEFVQPDKYTLEDILKLLSETLCDTNKLWLSRNEYEQLIMDGKLHKVFKFIDLQGYLIEMELVDTSVDMFDTADLENNYRFYISKDMIQSFKIVEDPIVSINVRH